VREPAKLFGVRLSPVEEGVAEAVAAMLFQ
jgi:hypothetical protein